MASLILIKLFFVGIVTVALDLAHTSPGKPLPAERTVVKGFLEKVVMFGTKNIKYHKTVFWVAGCLEMTAIVVSWLFPDSVSTTTFQKPLYYFTPISITGAFLILLGTYIRWQCFSALKGLFTFELSIRKEHNLITSWPYNVVRHPSYTGMLFVHIGVYLWFGSRGSWVRESGLLDFLPGQAFVAMFVIYLVLVMAGLLARGRIEDEELHKKFGKVWEVWARSVPYLIFPGIY